METNRERIVRRLLREGWILVRHGGNHDVYEHPETKARIQLPRHRTVSPGFARALIKENGWLDWR